MTKLLNHQRLTKTCAECGGTFDTRKLFYWHHNTGPGARCIPCTTRVKRERYDQHQARIGATVNPRVAR